MIRSNEELKQEAHKLALLHDPYIERKSSNRMQRAVQADVKKLRDFVEQLRESGDACSQPAEVWLLDHAEFIEEQVLVVSELASEKFVSRLPHLQKSGDTRVMDLCSNYLQLTEGRHEEDLFVFYLNCYQEVSPLTLAEAWALPVLMRIALIRRLADTMDVLRERREVCAMVERILAGFKQSELTADGLEQALRREGLELPLSGPLTVQLVKQLRELAQETSEVRDWLICKLENGVDTLDRIVSYEVQLQASFQVGTGNLIVSLRKLSRMEWNDAFERISLVEQTLRKEGSGDYERLDFSSRDLLRQRVEKLANRLNVPENLIAKQAVELADDALARQEASREETVLLPRDTFVAYYLLDPDGLKALHSALKQCSTPRAMPESGVMRRPRAAYFNALALTFALLLLGFYAWTRPYSVVGPGFRPMELALMLLVLIPVALEWAVTATHWMIDCVTKPRALLRYDFSHEVPEEAATLVVVPIIWSSAEDVAELLDRMELHYLANRDPNIHFALLSDFNDAKQQRIKQDTLILNAARAGIERLNQAYPGSTFHLFQRRREWNASEAVWMGWERKRGKLVEFVELLKGRTDTTYDQISGSMDVLRQIRYIITLDADTQLPLGSAQRMIGTMHLPYNRPRLNDSGTRIIEGYGVLQPRIGISHESAMRSRLAYLWSSEPGIDPYAFAVSDPYQDAFGQGIFTGKGIFDIEVFHRVLCNRIPDNRVLSHDLLEGGFLRAGLLSDIELIDGHPAAYNAYQKRQHRWTRGDWQLLLWLFPRAKDRQGRSLPVDLSSLTRWQMLDNLRRSLLPPMLLLLTLLVMLGLPGDPLRWLILLAATFMLPVIRQLLTFWRVLHYPKGLFLTFAQVLVTVVTLPYQAALYIDAIVRTLYRLAISKRHLLEWVSSAEVERAGKGLNQLPMLFLPAGYALTVLLVAASLWNGNPLLLTAGIAIAVLWALAPLAVGFLERPVHAAADAVSAPEAAELRQLAKDIWQYFEDYVTEHEHWLPPDNVQLDPPNGVARRTSPTNIGLYLTCVLSARDFDFIDTAGLIERLERTIDAIERLEKWEGHLYNWYDTATLDTLQPRYVSTVDSGNFVACLMTVKEGLVEWLNEDSLTGRQDKGSFDKDSLNVAFAEEIAPTLKLNRNGGRAAKPSKPAKPSVKEWKWRGERLAQRMDALVQATDFRPLYDHKSKLLVLGYHAGTRQRDQVLYDLMASEARQASFVAIALGQVSVSHWSALGRTMTKAGKGAALLSWTGTMFEYLMPSLLMNTYRDTIWDSTYHAVVNRQIEYARQRDVPFGISESGYYAYDYQMNYQYRAFGVPGLGFKRGLDEDLVIAPYAAIMALPFARSESMQALSRIDKLGGRGKYGYYEALDFTPERMPAGKRCMVIRSFMAHHQGMSMLTLSNMLLPRTMVARFHRDKRVRAAELLLQERKPIKPKLIVHPEMRRQHKPVENADDAAAIRSFAAHETRTPEVCLLSNGVYSAMVTASGGGFSRYEDLAVTRWREDAVMDHWGSYIYIRNVTRDQVWSPSYQPCRVVSPQQRITFSLDKAMFSRQDGDIQTSLEISVSPEWNAEVRRILLTNTGQQAQVIEVTTFAEISMMNPIADEAHPAFSKLFINTEYMEQEQCLIAKRRPREENEQTLCAAHSLLAEGLQDHALEFETDRARFIGRGHTLAEPKGLQTRLAGTSGSVADPAFIMRRRVQLEPGGQIQLLAVTAVAPTKEEAAGIVQQFASAQSAERTYELAWTRSRIELRHSQLTAAEAAGFQAFASQIFFTPPLRKERAAQIRRNEKGQSGLWSYGISGDRPAVMVRIEDENHLPFVVKLLLGHEYLRRLGLIFDLVILNESEGGYHQNMQEALLRAVERDVDRRGAAPSGIVVIPANQLPDEDRTLLIATSRVVLRANGPSLRAQMRLMYAAEALPEQLEPVAARERYGTEGGAAAIHEVAPEQLLFPNGWGGFMPDGKAYRLTIKNGNHLPAPWINVLANPNFGCLVTELGTGYTWWRNSRECKLTPWSNDPVLDPPAERAFLRDEHSGEVWTVTPSAAMVERPYEVTHGFGYSRFVHERHGLHQETTVFVPLSDSVKVLQVKVRNDTSDMRYLSLTYYAEWVLGVKRSSNAPFIVTEWVPESQILHARNTYQEVFRDANAFLAMYAAKPEGQHVGISPDANRSWTVDRAEFIGRGGTLEQPAALQRQELSGRTGAMNEPCGAIQQKFSLDPGEERTLYVLLGCESSKEAAGMLARKYSHAEACLQALQEVQKFWQQVTRQIQVTTPSKEMDTLLNGWLIYQSLGCRMWARTAFFQAGGAYGYRDQLQDSLSMLHVKPELTRRQIILHAAHQYEEGDVQHWWHEETQRGIRTKFSDDLLWLPYSVSRYITHTGDSSVLEEQAPYLTSDLLTEDEHERYEETKLSGKMGTVWEHAIKTIDLALRRIGEHGLPLIGIGDWNDGMNHVGSKGRGESVWLGWFLIDILTRFEPLCRARGLDEMADRYIEAREQLKAALDEHGWDGQWYRRAFTDHGTWLGSISSEECRIDAIAQSWSIISGGAPPDKAQQAMSSFDRELVDRELSLVRLLTPPFDRTRPSPGYIQGYPPGIRENGAQYTHGVIWGIVAWSKLGNGDKAFELFNMLNPINHTRTISEVRSYTGEPYVMAADIYTADPHKGHAGWTWYTGAAGWMYQVGVEWILGLQREQERLYVRPCIPPEWPSYTATYRFGNTTYSITVHNPSRKATGCSRIETNGAATGGAAEGEELFIVLRDDGKLHEIVVTM